MEVVIAYLGNVSIREICEHYGIHRSTVRDILIRHGYQTSRGKRTGR